MHQHLYLKFHPIFIPKKELSKISINILFRICTNHIKFIFFNKFCKQLHTRSLFPKCLISLIGLTSPSPLNSHLSIITFWWTSVLIVHAISSACITAEVLPLVKNCMILYFMSFLPSCTPSFQAKLYGIKKCVFFFVRSTSIHKRTKCTIDKISRS